jgi:hypothetical protein
MAPEGTSAESRKSARDTANQSSRLDLGSPYILHLPNEIFLDILKNVETSDATADSSTRKGHTAERNVEDIRNARLVCRKFCDLASRFLVRVMHVRPDRKSLDWLDRISRHPTISQGVRTIWVDLHFTITNSPSLTIS